MLDPVWQAAGVGHREVERVRSSHVLRLVATRSVPLEEVVADVQRSRVLRRTGGRAVAAVR